jgi:dipeptidyl aminopeptidase/acylaminoacyl peptidase
MYNPQFTAGNQMRKFVCLVVLSLAVRVNSSAQTKPKLTLDDFFNSVSFPSAAVSPDGNSVVIVTDRADWDQQTFRKDLWLYRDANGGSLIQLTESGHDDCPQWSPDGRWIAFLSGRKTASDSADSDEADTASSDSKDEGVEQIYLISPSGGEAFAITEGQEEVHSFAWSADSRAIYFSTPSPWTKSQKDAYKKEWKDTVQYRTAERGDTIFALDLASALATHQASIGKVKTKEEKQSDLTPEARAISASPLRVDQLVTSPDGKNLAFLTSSINRRQEKYADFEIYTVELASARPETARQVTNNEGQEQHISWANDSRHIFFTVETGNPLGPYRDFQPHLYWVDTVSGMIEQWAKEFNGSTEHYAVSENSVLSSGRLGTEVQMYAATAPSHSRPVSDWRGTLEDVFASPHSQRVAFVYSSLDQPSEVYLANSAADIKQAHPITALNKFLSKCDLPQGKPYQWKSDDGTTVEGMLVYPPEKFGGKKLPTFVFIHGGPDDADGFHFGGDWYQWGALAAVNGWLVFEPNYRGSTGYGDNFLNQIVPEIVSRPGKDILAGVDSLVKDGISDPDHLTIGGYSYGGYMTNWLITQTTRFKAAVTGAGAVENVGNWGNDDTTFDDAYFLGGRPWEAAQRYHDEAAIFHIDKVRTPTHMVAGGDDIRVAVLEDYLLEHALYSLGIPNALLIFPGEGHSLDKNPWHGKIKVREELKWLQKYGGVPTK